MRIEMPRREALRSIAASVAAFALPPSALGAAPRQAILEARPGNAPLLGASNPVPVWAYRDRVPGPVIRARQGDTVRLRLKNALPQPTSIHWHGIRIDNAMDGVSGLTQAPAPSGGIFDYEFTVPDAGTFWYHPHHRAWEQMARGLYGLLIVEEREPPHFDSDRYFVADDWRIDREGLIDEKSFGAMRDWSHGGRLGNFLTVNGRSRPEIAVKAGERVRLRCVNVANSRIFNFDFGALRPVVIALDGQPTPVTVLDAGGLVLAPGQRADLAFDAPAEPGARIPIRMATRREPFTVAYIAVTDGPRAGHAPLDELAPLPANPLPGPLDRAGAQRIELLMEGGAMGGLRDAVFEGKRLDIRALVKRGKVWAFNGVVGKPLAPLARIARGRTVEINIVNRTGWPHAMHLHGFHFRVVERNGRPVVNAPWRDTELVNANEQVRIAFVADNPGKWLLHCHMLEHQAGGMLTWIEVA